MNMCRPPGVVIPGRAFVFRRHKVSPIDDCQSKHLYRQVLTACPYCDLMLKRHQMAIHQYSQCPRCHSKIEHVQDNSPSALKWTVIAALLFYFPANFFPLVAVDIAGNVTETSVFDGVLLLAEQDKLITAAIVMFCSLIVPTFIIMTFTALLIAVKYRLWPPFQRYCVRLLVHLRDWSMLDIYLLSFVVAMFKIRDLGELQMEVGIFAFVGLTLSINKLFISYDRRALWQLIRK